MSLPPPVAERLARARRRALVAAAVFAALSAIGAIFDVQQLFRSYLLAFLFLLGIPLGSFAVAQIHAMTGGGWGMPVRRVMEAAARTLPLLALLFLPIALGLHDLYEWTHAEVVEHDALLQHKQPYLNVPFFIGRAVLYFAVWIGLMRVQDRLSARQDETDDVRLVHRQRTIAAFALGAYALTMSFASFDWAMSLEPHWFSSIYGVIWIVGQGLTAFAFAIVVSSQLARHEPLASVATPERLHDVGKLMFASVFLWAYVNFSQYLLIWSANVLEEIPWYLARTRGGWQWVANVLIAFHFALPFLVLLSRAVKRNRRALAAIAVLLLAMRWIDALWYVAPAFHPADLTVHWMDVAVTLALAGLWFAFFTRQLEARPLLLPRTQQPHGDLEPSPVPHRP